MQSPAAAIFLQDKFSYYSSPARIRIEKNPFNIIVKWLLKTSIQSKGPCWQKSFEISLIHILAGEE